MYFSPCNKFCIVCGPFYLLNSWPFWPVFYSKFCLFFSHTLSIFKVMLRNLNLTKCDMLTLLRSNMTAPTLKTNEHLKKQRKHGFVLIFLTPTEKSFFHTLSWSSKRNYFISGIYIKFMCSITFSYSHDCQKSGKKSTVTKEFKFLWTQLDGRFFWFFLPQDPKP